LNECLLLLRCVVVRERGGQIDKWKTVTQTK
jgi:hypothetical protein